MKTKITLASSVLISLLSASMVMAADINSSKLPGYDFSLLDIEKACVAKRDGGSDSLSVKCKGNHLKQVARSCEGFINGGLENVRLNCGGGLWSLNSKCKIEMRGASKGEFNCKL